MVHGQSPLTIRHATVGHGRSCLKQFEARLTLLIVGSLRPLYLSVKLHCFCFVALMSTPLIRFQYAQQVILLHSVGEAISNNHCIHPLGTIRLTSPACLPTICDEAVPCHVRATFFASSSHVQRPTANLSWIHPAYMHEFCEEAARSQRHDWRTSGGPCAEADVGPGALGFQDMLGRLNAIEISEVCAQTFTWQLFREDK